MKKTVYIILFVILGLLVQQIAHGVIESWIIFLLVRDFDKFGLSLSWDKWFYIHNIFSLVLLLSGVGFGFWAGKHFWKVVYIDKKYKKFKRW